MNGIKLNKVEKEDVNMKYMKYDNDTLRWNSKYKKWGLKIWKVYTTQFQYNPSNDCGGGMKMKVVK